MHGGPVGWVERGKTHQHALAGGGFRCSTHPRAREGFGLVRLPRPAPSPPSSGEKDGTWGGPRVCALQKVPAPPRFYPCRPPPSPQPSSPEEGERECAAARADAEFFHTLYERVKDAGFPLCSPPAFGGANSRARPSSGASRHLRDRLPVRARIRCPVVHAFAVVAHHRLPAAHDAGKVADLLHGVAELG
jgi:hypothetical protein